MSTIWPWEFRIWTKYNPEPPQVLNDIVEFVPDAVIGVVETCWPIELIILILPPVKFVILLKLILICVLAGFGNIVILLAYNIDSQKITDLR